MLVRTLLLASSVYLQAATPDGGIVTIKGRQLLAEVARTPRERERALAFRSGFKAERCLFVACEQNRPHPVNTRKFLLHFDIVWVDEGGTVVEIREKVPPCTTAKECPEHGGSTPSRYYLFLASGMVRRLRLKPGDYVQWDIHFSDGGELRNGPHMHPEEPPVQAKAPGKRISRGKRK